MTHPTADGQAGFEPRAHLPVPHPVRPVGGFWRGHLEGDARSIRQKIRRRQVWRTRASVVFWDSGRAYHGRREQGASRGCRVSQETSSWVGVDTEPVIGEQKWPQKSQPLCFELRKPNLRHTLRRSLEREDLPCAQKARWPQAHAWRIPCESPTPVLPLQWNKWPMWFSTQVTITSSRWPPRKRSE